MKIILLVQDKNNRSILLLAESIQKKLLAYDNAALFVWEIKDVECSDDQLSISNGIDSIRISDISLAIKRTWGPIREKGLVLCQALEKGGVAVLNGCEFIKWSHSKIQQYQSLELHQKNCLFPETVYVDAKCIENIINKNLDNNLAQRLLEHVYPSYKFPMVLKKDKGCRADGVYYIKSLEEFGTLLSKDLQSLRNGFLLQKFISSNDDMKISNYYRLNVVSGRVQSAVQFQLMWETTKECDALKLVEFKQANELPVELNIFPQARLQEIVDACPYPQDVVGIDVMFDGVQLYLLEYNDGPAISLVVDLGEKYLSSNIPEQLQAARACYNFAESIASLCIERALQSVSRKQQMIVYAFENSKSKPDTVLEINAKEQASVETASKSQPLVENSNRHII